VLALQHTAGNAVIGRLLARAVAVPRIQRATTFDPTDWSQTYAVSGTTLADARAAIDAHDPDEAGTTSWSPTNTTANNGTKVTKADVNVSIAVEMPSWPGASGLGQNAKAEWLRFFAALKAHEQGHVSVAQKGFAGADRKLIGKPIGTVDKAFKTIVDGVQTCGDKYDAATDHGRKKGTELDDSIT
jgi:predicted secreted Zn-dependent protease